MDYHIFKSALNRFLFKYIGGKQRPVFFNIDDVYPALNALTQHYLEIREEFDKVYQSRQEMPLYHEIDPGEKAISNSTEKKWKVFMLYLLGYKPEENRKLCQNTCAILDKVPNLVQAFFSILEPGKSIPLHDGPYYGYLRYHLGLRVPKERPPELYVNGQQYIWQEGKAVLFDDSWPHEVKNQSNEYRAVLIVDVLRPMPMLPTLVNRFVTGLIAKYTYGRRVVQRVKGYQPSDAPVIN